jgi:hypothetical protein
MVNTPQLPPDALTELELDTFNEMAQRLSNDDLSRFFGVSYGRLKFAYQGMYSRQGDTGIYRKWGSVPKATLLAIRTGLTRASEVEVILERPKIVRRHRGLRRR